MEPTGFACVTLGQGLRPGIQESEAMKIFPLIAAAAVAFVAMPAVASAAPAQDHHTMTTTTTVERHDDRGDRHMNRGRGHWRTVCTTSWRHHHRVRTCRKVRSW
jgi:hypothetical protein